MKSTLMIAILAMSAATFTPNFTYADDPPAVSAPADAVQVAPQSSGEKVVGVLKEADSKIPLAIPAWLLGALVFVVEVFVRFVPTAKPRSIFLLIAAVFGLIGSIFGKLSSLLDSFAQNLKPDA